jgi:hypothetical protein
MTKAARKSYAKKRGNGIEVQYSGSIGIEVDLELGFRLQTNCLMATRCIARAQEKTL